MTLHLSHESLIEEQAQVQADKCNVRLLREYDSYIFISQQWREPRPSDVVEFLEPFTDGELSLSGLLRGMHAEKQRQIQWTDVGSGRALAQRQVLSDPELITLVSARSVDLFNVGLAGLKDSELEYLESHSPGSTLERSQPEIVIANAETIDLWPKADVITSIEMVQYLQDPVKTVANLYNQLEDNGLLLMANECDWSSWVRFEEEKDYDAPRPMAVLLDNIRNSGLEYAVSEKADAPNGMRFSNPNEFAVLAIKKVAGTRMFTRAKPTKVWLNPWNYKAVYYEQTDKVVVIDSAQ